MTTPAQVWAATQFDEVRLRLAALEERWDSRETDSSKPLLERLATDAIESIQYDLLTRELAGAYLTLLDLIEVPAWGGLFALRKALDLEAVSERPWPKHAAVLRAAANAESIEEILDEIRMTQTSGSRTDAPSTSGRGDPGDLVH